MSRLWLGQVALAVYLSYHRGLSSGESDSYICHDFGKCDAGHEVDYSTSPEIEAAVVELSQTLLDGEEARQMVSAWGNQIPLHFPRSHDRSNRHQLLSVDHMDSLITAMFGNHTFGNPITDLYESVLAVKRVVGDDGEYWSAKIPPEGLRSPQDYFTAFQHGFTIVINRANRVCRPLAKAALELESVFGFRVNANIYMTPPTAQGFEIHFDWMDVMVLQLHGSKSWNIYKQLVEYPLEYNKYKPTALEVGEPVKRLTLHEGDFLYLPRGMVHEASTVDGGATASMHVTFGLEVDPSLTYLGFFYFALELFCDNYVDVLRDTHGIPPKTILARVIHFMGEEIPVARKPFPVRFRTKRETNETLAFLQSRLLSDGRALLRRVWSERELHPTTSDQFVVDLLGVLPSAAEQSLIGGQQLIQSFVRSISVDSVVQVLLEALSNDQMLRVNAMYRHL